MKILSPKQKEYLSSTIRNVADFPKAGILFKDITTLLGDAKAFKFLIEHLYERYKDMNLDYIVGIESRGFIFGAALASKLGVGFVPARKPNKLPYTTISQKYSLEYGTDELQMHIDAFGNKPGANVLLIDDLIATGGTAKAACEMITKLGAHLIELAFIIDINIGGIKELEGYGPIYVVLGD